MGILRHETSRSAGSRGASFVEDEAEAKVLLEACVCGGATEISCAWLEIAEHEKKATKENAARMRENRKKRTIDEEFPLNRAGGTGKLHRAFPSIKMAWESKRFASATQLLSRLFSASSSG
jgi:hypothetical protein